MSNGRHCSWELAKEDEKKKIQRTRGTKGLTTLSGRSLLSSLVSDQKSMLENGLTAASQ